MHSTWPPRLLIADEVGLGKTIEAGLLLRQTWLSGRARRILVLAPKAVLTQWQIELREKFNLDWPIYDGDSLVWQATPAHRDGVAKPVSRQDWHREPFIIASSHLMRRRERQTELILDAEPWDLVVLDEAHHARRKNPGAPGEGGPNLLLRLMQGMVQQQRALGLLLLTATPMQVHPVEVWDLVALLGLPPEWSPQAFLEYFAVIGRGNPSHPDFDKLAALFRATERRYGETPLELAQTLVKDGTRDAMTIPSLPAPPLTMAYLARVLRDSEVLPPGVEVRQRSEIEFSWRAPGMPEALRVTTDLDFYENHSSSVEFWSAGSPLFPSAE